MRLLLATTAILLATTTPANAQDIRGVWKPVEMLVTGGAEPGLHPAQPGLIIFTDQHYSYVHVQGLTARQPLSANPTDEERIKTWRPFVANAGTYALKDSILTVTMTISKNPNDMTGVSRNSRVRIRGDTLWFFVRESDGSQRQNKWVRVEQFPRR